MTAPERNALVLANLNLVWYLVSRLPPFWVTKLGGRADAGQIGALALLRAVDGFDPEYGVRFSTYASRVILSRLRDAACASDLIRVPRLSIYRDAAERARRLQQLPAVTGGHPSAWEPAAAEEPQPDYDDDAGERVAAALAELPATWRDVVEARSRGETLQVIGARLGCSKERVRQLYGKALARLRDRLGVELQEVVH